MGARRSWGTGGSIILPFRSFPFVPPKVVFMHSEEFLNLNQAASFLGLHKSSLLRLAKRPDGPPRMRLSLRAVRYRRSELIDWANSKLELPKMQAKA